MIDDPASWSPIQRRRWAIELVLQHVALDTVEDAIVAAETIDQYLGEPEPMHGIAIRQAPFGAAP